MSSSREVIQQEMCNRKYVIDEYEQEALDDLRELAREVWGPWDDDN